jgi:hypothetical protein
MSFSCQSGWCSGYRAAVHGQLVRAMSLWSSVFLVSKRVGDYLLNLSRYCPADNLVQSSCRERTSSCTHLTSPLSCLQPADRGGPQSYHIGRTNASSYLSKHSAPSLPPPSPRKVGTAFKGQLSISDVFYFVLDVWCGREM